MFHCNKELLSIVNSNTFSFVSKKFEVPKGINHLYQIDFACMGADFCSHSVPVYIILNDKHKYCLGETRFHQLTNASKSNLFTNSRCTSLIISDSKGQKKFELKEGLKNFSIEIPGVPSNIKIEVFVYKVDTPD